MGLLEGLNSDQLAAIKAGDGPVLIVAGPGTGKTKTLITRIAYLIETDQTKPQEILALTFTKKAAEEMQKRLAVKDVKVCTFHALCSEILGDNGALVSEAQRLQIIQSLHKTKGLKGVSARELSLLISRAKNTTEDADPATADIVSAYNQALADQKVHDFDDLLLNVYKLLKKDAKKRAAAAKYKYILVDEFQDTNRLQYEILRLLVKNDNLFVIGDPQQSIYGFRGAHGGIFDQSKADYPKHKQITLNINYRSVPEVVSLSNAIFTDTPDLSAHNTKAGSVRAVEVLNEYSEAAWVINEIQKAIGGGDLQQAISNDLRADHHRLSDFAVIYRSRRPAAVLKTVLEESGLPYQVVGDGSPYDKPQAHAMLALMRAAANNQNVDLEGFTASQQQLLSDIVHENSQASPQDFAQKCMTVLGLEPDRDLQQMLSVLVRHQTLSSALEYFDQIAGQGFYDPGADAITLLTIHASKGLEFSQVFIIGAEEGILPAARASDLNEERRLFYVAVTRAKDRLDILHTKKRAGQDVMPSSFITQLPHDILSRQVDPDMQDQIRRLQKRAAKRSQQSLF